MTFINGVLLGSVGALASVLGIILFFRWVMTLDATLDQTVVQSGLPLGELLRDMCIFTALSGVALAAFWGELRMRPWRVGADWLLAVSLAGVAVYFFAEPAARPRDLGVLGVAAVAGMLIYGAASSLGLLARLSRWLGD